MRNLDIIKDYSYQLWDQKDITAIDRFFDANAIVHSPLESTRGIAKMKAIIQQWFQGIPDMKVHWDEFICEDNKVVSRWHCEGKHQGEFLGYPPSNHHIHYPGVTIYHLENDKITDYWAFVDMDNVKKQIGE